MKISFMLSLCHFLLRIGTVSAYLYFSSSVFRSPSSRYQVTSTNRFSAKNALPKPQYDVIVVGSGIGGLSCAAILSLYNYSVAVFESHYAPGGCAHGYRIKADRDENDLLGKDRGVQSLENARNDKSGGYFHFDTGPSFFSGINTYAEAKTTSNPLKSILDAIGEEVDCIPYRTFGLKFPEGDFVHSPQTFAVPGGLLDQATSSSRASLQWQRMMKAMKPLSDAVLALPTAALRTDIGVMVTTAPYIKDFLSATSRNPFDSMKLGQPFSKFLDAVGLDAHDNVFARNWLDLLCFCLSGLPTNGTVTAEMAMMMTEFYDSDAIMDCPRGGAKAIVDALVRGIKKRGGDIFTNAHVQKILIEGGRATGIMLKKCGSVISSNKAVVSNLSVWDLYSSGIVNTSCFPKSFISDKMDTPVGKSFMHLHVGFRISREELTSLQAHYICIENWERGVMAEDNVVLVSIPSVHDDSLAPPGFGVLHAYTPATEEFDRWENIKYPSDEYEELKVQRSQYLWKVLETIIPDIKKRARSVQVGTPLTHQRFLRRYKGSYGPAIVAGEATFPFPDTPVQGLKIAGDSCFPGIGVPAVAGSGLLAAHSISIDSVLPQIEMLKGLRVKQEEGIMRNS